MPIEPRHWLLGLLCAALLHLLFFAALFGHAPSADGTAAAQGEGGIQIGIVLGSLEQAPPPPMAEAPAKTEQPVQNAPMLKPADQGRLAPKEKASPEKKRPQEEAKTTGKNHSKQPQATTQPSQRGLGGSHAGGGQQGTATHGYHSLLRAHLERYKTYPARAKRRKQQGTATLRLTIAASGQITAATISQSSGKTALDQAALALSRQASPVPKPPKAPMIVTVPLTYRLDS